MAFEIRAGTGGVNAGLFRFSQPRGAVMTTSSNVWVEPEVVPSTVAGFPLSGSDWRDLIDVTVLEN